MAYTAHKDEESMREHYESPEVLAEKIDLLVDMIRKSKHMVVFTGAGISTDAGIPDFRGPEGVWTLKAQGKLRSKPTTDTLSAVPTATHMSIVELMNRGILKYLISQNCDGLHRRSGVPPENISELHGNGNIEFCETCGYEYLRDFHCYRIKHGSKDHFTGRYCVLPNCGGRLMNSTIDFGQSLPVRPLELADYNSGKADLHLAMGSSLTVSPACNMPKKTAKKGGNLVIVNLQKTPLDHLATLRIFQKCDVVMKEVMKRLDIEIPPFRLRRNFSIQHSIQQGGIWDIAIKGFDYGTDGSEIPASTIKAVQVLLPQEFPDRKLMLEKEPFRIRAKMAKMPMGDTGAILRFHMMGHYAEPPVDVILKMTDSPHTVWNMTYNPKTGEWVQRKLSDESAEKEEKEEDEKEKEREAGKEKESDMEIEPTIKITEFESHGTPTPGNWGAAVTALNADRIPLVITFGGSGVDREFAPISYFDIRSKTWTVNSDSGSNLPYLGKRRWGHSATVVTAKNPAAVYLIGGWDSSSQYNDVHIYDANSHELSSVKTSGTAPNFRAGHSAVAYGKNIVVFGGAICSGGPYEFYNDTFLFNTEKNQWTKLNCKGDIPSGRAQHSATLFDKIMIVIGGYTGDSLTNDVYALNLETLEWKHINAKGNLPPRRDDLQMKDFQVYPARHSASLLAKRGKSYLAFVGEGGVYLLNLSNWTWSKPVEEQEDTKAGSIGTQVLTTGLTCHCVAPLTANTVYLLGGKVPHGEANNAMLLLTIE